MTEPMKRKDLREGIESTRPRYVPDKRGNEPTKPRVVPPAAPQPLKCMPSSKETQLPGNSGEASNEKRA
jgi:hypothetical protein